MCRYNGLRVAKIKDGKCTLEYSIVGREDWHTATRGDIGSLLCSPSSLASVVGMIIDGYEYNDIALFTRIDELVEDIKEQSGANDVRMWEG